MVFYILAKYGLNQWKNPEAIKEYHHCVALTHAHPRNLIACGVYLAIIDKIVAGGNPLNDCIERGALEALEYYGNTAYKDEINVYKRLSDCAVFAKTPEEQIKGSGYVVETLEAVIWCLLNTDNYKDATLKAVNLGLDTDTVAAITGGIAGLYYGMDGIPGDWLAKLQNRGLLDKIYTKFVDTIAGKHSHSEDFEL